jgi:hypothetical protein
VTTRHPSIHKSWHQISPTRGGRSVGIVRLWTKGLWSFVLFFLWHSLHVTSRSGIPRITLTGVLTNCVCIRNYFELQRPRGMKHKLSSPTRTLGLWVQISHKACMFLYIYFVLMFSCVHKQRSFDRLIPANGVFPTVYRIKKLKRWPRSNKWTVGQQ